MTIINEEFRYQILIDKCQILRILCKWRYTQLFKQLGELIVGIRPHLLLASLNPCCYLLCLVELDHLATSALRQQGSCCASPCRQGRDCLDGVKGMNATQHTKQIQIQGEGSLLLLLHISDTYLAQLTSNGVYI